MHPTTGYTAPYGHECHSSGAPVQGSPGGPTQKRGRRPLEHGDRWSASDDRQGTQVTAAQLFACRSAHPGHVVILIVPVGLMHPALAEDLIRAGERLRHALRPVPRWTVWPRVRGRFPATTNAGKRLYLLRRGGKERLDEDRHSRIAVETCMGREVAGMEGLYSHVALAMEQEIADSLQSRWLHRSWSARESTGRRHLPLLYHSILKSGGKQQVKAAQDTST